VTPHSSCGKTILVNQPVSADWDHEALKHGINSFINTNMHPEHRLPFEDWLRKIASCIRMTDASFKTELGFMTIFDVMLTFWKAWTTP
jgi:hypothetical protein